MSHTSLLCPLCCWIRSISETRYGLYNPLSHQLALPEQGPCSTQRLSFNSACHRARHPLSGYQGALLRVCLTMCISNIITMLFPTIPYHTIPSVRYDLCITSVSEPKRQESQDSSEICGNIWQRQMQYLSANNGCSHEPSSFI